jgi:hypothetical protein
VAHVPALERSGDGGDLRGRARVAAVRPDLGAWRSRGIAASWQPGVPRHSRAGSSHSPGPGCSRRPCRRSAGAPPVRARRARSYSLAASAESVLVSR